MNDKAIRRKRRRGNCTWYFDGNCYHAPPRPEATGFVISRGQQTTKKTARITFAVRACQRLRRPPDNNWYNYGRQVKWQRRDANCSSITR